MILGQYLKRDREARHISVGDVSRATHMSVGFIQALETDDFYYFSQPENIPGYLQLYCRHTGLDYDDVLKRYQSQLLLNPRHDEGSIVTADRKLFSYGNTPIQRAAGAKTSRRKLFQKNVAHNHLLSLAIVIGALVGLLILWTGGESLITDPFKSAGLQQDETQQKTPSHSLAEGFKGSSHLLPRSANSEQLPEQPVMPDLPMDPSSPNPSVARSVPTTTAPATPARTSPVSGMPSPSAGLSPTPAPPVLPRKENPTVVGNSDSRRYHRPGMKYCDKIKAFHRVEFASEEAAIRAGYHRAAR